MPDLTLRQFTAKLRAAGWCSFGGGVYRHSDRNATFNCFDAPGGREMWRWYAERDELPDPERSQAERHRRVARGNGLRRSEAQDG